MLPAFIQTHDKNISFYWWAVIKASLFHKRYVFSSQSIKYPPFEA